MDKTMIKALRAYRYQLAMAETYLNNYYKMKMLEKRPQAIKYWAKVQAIVSTICTLYTGLDESDNLNIELSSSIMHFMIEAHRRNEYVFIEEGDTF